MTFSQQELRLLVDMLRLSRVTLLVAETGTDKSAVLRSGVLPLLTKRQRGVEAEIPVLFDEWERRPLDALHARMREAAGAAGAAVSEAASGSLIEDLDTW